MTPKIKTIKKSDAKLIFFFFLKIINSKHEKFSNKNKMKGNCNGTAVSWQARTWVVHTEFYPVTRIYIANEISFLLLSVFHKRRMIDSYVTSRPLFDDFTRSVKGSSSCSFPTEDSIIINSLCISQRKNFLVLSYLKKNRL